MEEQKHKNIEAQVERWDLYARLVPTLFLIIAVVLVAFQVIDFEEAFWIGIGIFALTAVTWWFWTIYTIRFLVKTLQRASKNLGEVRKEFRDISAELKNIRDENEGQ